MVILMELVQSIEETQYFKSKHIIPFIIKYGVS